MQVNNYVLKAVPHNTLKLSYREDYLSRKKYIFIITIREEWHEDIRLTHLVKSCFSYIEIIPV